MILYHGSTTDIDRIDLAKSRPNKDFGKAFYLSDVKKQALEMAAFKADFEGGTPVINAYTPEWAHFVYDHRTEPQGLTLHDYDIVYGPIANDRIGAQITRYKQGYINFDEFLRRIQFPEGITFQYAFCTPQAVQHLQKI